MNQQCKVCGEPAAGFHFGAFTCEGCKSFFGRSYNNLSSISECKNNGECIINKKNRTACKACRLRKCLLVGMSKSGSRYGRRSNWFKIHCLLQEQQQAAERHANNQKSGVTPNLLAPPTPFGPGGFSRPPCTMEELKLLGFEEHYKQSSASPSISSPDSHNSDSSIEIRDSEKRNLMMRNSTNKMPTNEIPALPKELPFLPLPFSGIPGLMPPPGFLPPSQLPLFGYHPALYHQSHQSLLKQQAEQQNAFITNSSNNNSRFIANNNNNITKKVEEFSKRFYLDAILQSQKSPFERESSRTPTTPTPITTTTDEKDDKEVLKMHHTNNNISSKEEISTITPPRSPCLTPGSVTTASAAITHQDNPIDLSMKATSSTHDEQNSFRGSSVVSEDDDRTSSNHEMASVRSNNVSEESESDDDSVVYKNESKRMKIQGTTTTPLDLTTKA